MGEKNENNLRSIDIAMTKLEQSQSTEPKTMKQRSVHTAAATMEIENALQELNQNSVSAHSHSHYEYNNMNNNPQFVQSYSQSTAYPAPEYALYSEYNHPNLNNYIAQ